MALELVATAKMANVEPWSESAVPADHSLRGFHSVSAVLEGYERTAKLIIEVFGYRLISEAGNRFRFASHDENAIGRFIDLLCMPDSEPAAGGAGSVHHIAFRARDDEEQRAWREKIVSLGFNVSPIMDRTYFHSIYFREPGGVLFEIATDLPGFTLDESFEELGNNLKVPSQYEDARSEIEKVLPPIMVPRKGRK
jgi:glyoxalase family protein